MLHQFGILFEVIGLYSVSLAYERNMSRRSTPGVQACTLESVTKEKDMFASETSVSLQARQV